MRERGYPVKNEAWNRPIHHVLEPEILHYTEVSQRFYTAVSHNPGGGTDSRRSLPEIATRTTDATALGLVGSREEGKDALVHLP